jgi:hypothetical protein
MLDMREMNQMLTSLQSLPLPHLLLTLLNRECFGLKIKIRAIYIHVGEIQTSVKQKKRSARLKDLASGIATAMRLN